MYIKFCQRYKGDSKQECGAKLYSHPKLCVALEGGEGDDKQTAPTAGKIHAYKAASIVLAVLSALLLVATIILALKLQNGSAVSPVKEGGRSFSAEECKSVCPTIQPPRQVTERVQNVSIVCPVTKEDRSCSAEECKLVCPTVQSPREVTRIVQNVSVVCPVTKKDRSCSAEECKSVCPTVQPSREVTRRGYLCHQCPRGWVMFEEQCFYLSTTRLNWTLSQKNCSDSGGALAVIDSQEIQEFLTRKGKLDYWIGLKHDKLWTWVDNTVLQKSYWEDNPPHSRGCAVLHSSNSAGKNWKTQSCSLYTYFICQLLL